MPRDILDISAAYKAYVTWPDTAGAVCVCSRIGQAARGGAGGGMGKGGLGWQGWDWLHWGYVTRAVQKEMRREREEGVWVGERCDKLPIFARQYQHKWRVKLRQIYAAPLLIISSKSFKMMEREPNDCKPGFMVA